MKENTNVNDEVDDLDVHEDWEYEYTHDQVEQFLEETVLPILEGFDFHRDDENYVAGVATFTLYTKLIEILSENGWSVEDLKNAIDEFASIDLSESFH